LGSQPAVGARGGVLRFVSVFKAERRKGYDVLLRAFLEAFAAPPGRAPPAVELHVLVSAFVSRVPDEEQLVMEALGQERAAQLDRARVPPVFISSEQVSRADYVSFLAAGDVFVLPTRGEGWCGGREG
jgi:hypothetical protein